MNDYVPLGDLIKSISQTHSFNKEKLVFLNTSDVYEGNILVNHYTNISELKGQAKKTIMNGDILYSEIRPKNKRYAYVKNVKDVEDYVVSTKLMVLRNSSRNLDTDYLYHFLTSKKTLDYLQQRAENRIGSFPQITFDVLKAIRIWLPDIKVQKKIASVLSSLDAKIELNNRINAELEQMAKTLYEYWFVQFDFPISAEQAAAMGKPELEGKPYKSSGGKMVYNAELKREIPEGWEVERIVNEMSVQYGYPFSTKFFNAQGIGAPIVRIRDILGNKISVFSTEEADDRYKLEKGDLLIGMDGNFHINFWNKSHCYLNQRCVRIRKKKHSRISQFQAFFDVSPYIQAREKNVSRTTVGHLSARDINSLNVLIPDSEMLISKTVLFDDLLKKIIINRNENQQLASLRDWLLPMLMNGQVTVKEAEEEVRQAMAAEPEATYEKR